MKASITGSNFLESKIMYTGKQRSYTVDLVDGKTRGHNFSYKENNIREYVLKDALALSGYNIEDTVNFWRRFAVEVPNSIYASTTHPSTSERFIRMEATIKEIQDKINNGDILLPTYNE